MYMRDWVAQLDKFLLADDRDILQHAGSISAAVAKEKAEHELEQYRMIEDKNYQSDFDLFLQSLDS